MLTIQEQRDADTLTRLGPPPYGIRRDIWVAANGDETTARSLMAEEGARYDDFRRGQ